MSDPSPSPPLKVWFLTFLIGCGLALALLIAFLVVDDALQYLAAFRPPVRA